MTATRPPRSASRTVILLVFTALTCRSALAGGRTLQPAETPQTTLTGEIELVRLIDLASARLGLNVDYDAATVSGRVVVRLAEPISDEELWALMNRLLVLGGMTTVQPDPEDFPGSYAIVRLQDAAGLAPPTERLGESVLQQPGFTSILVRIQHIGVNTALSAVKEVLSRTGSNAVAIGDSGLILLSDLRLRIDQAVDVLSMIDVPGDPILVDRILLEHQPASRVVTTLTALAAAHRVLQGDRDRGPPSQFIADPDDKAVFLVTPTTDVARWRETIRQLDAPPHVGTRTYVPRNFPLEDVARLIEGSLQSSTAPSAGTARDHFRIVRDELTGSLLVTASPRQHEQVEAIIERLNSAPPELRRPLRTFPIHHRSASEVLSVLDDLIASGLLDPESDEAPLPATSPTESSSVVAGEEDSNERLRNGGADVQLPAQHNRSAGGSESGMWMTVDEGTNSLIAIGEPRRLDQVQRLIDSLDIRQPQVLLEVLIVSLNEGQTLDLGVEIEKFEVSGETTIRLASLFGLSTSSDSGRSVGDPAGGTAVILSPGDFNIVVRALETLNEGRSLSVPRVLVSNNQTANLDSVLQQPFTQTNASDTVATTSFGGFENAGTTLTITPRITRADHLLLEYAVALSDFVGESSDPNIPPPRQQNRLSSTATIPDGFVVAVGGLELQSEAEAESRVPLLGAVPLLGEAFKNRSQSRSTSRFFVFIRPTILRHLELDDLKYLSEEDLHTAGLDDGWPTVEPRIIRE